MYRMRLRAVLILLIMALPKVSGAQCVHWQAFLPHGTNGAALTPTAIAADIYGATPTASDVAYPSLAGQNLMTYATAAYQPISGAMPTLCANPLPSSNSVGYRVTTNNGSSSRSEFLYKFPGFPANIRGVQTGMALLTEDASDTINDPTGQSNLDLITLQGSDADPTHYHFITAPSISINLNGNHYPVGGSEISIYPVSNPTCNQNGLVNAIPWDRVTPTLFTWQFSNVMDGATPDKLAAYTFQGGVWTQLGSTIVFQHNNPPCTSTILNSTFHLGNGGSETVTHAVFHIDFSWAAICMDLRDGSCPFPMLPYDPITLETAADGSGTTIPSQTLSNGATKTAYCIDRNPGGVFVANVACTFSLTAKTGGTTNANLVAAGDNKSAVFTASAPGSAVITAYDSHVVTANSGTIAALGAAPGLPVFRFR